MELTDLLKSLPMHSEVYNGKQWLEDPNHYPNYAKLFSSLNMTRLFEVGSLVGYSLITAVWACPHLESIHWVDDESGQPNSNEYVKANLEFALQKLGREVVSSHGRQIGNNKFVADVAHIDGAHDYDSVMRDLNKCKNQLGDLQYIVGHDYFLEGSGVAAAVKDFCKANNLEYAYSNKLTNGVFVIAVQPEICLHTLPAELDFKDAK